MGLQKFKLLARDLTLVPVANSRLYGRDFNQMGTRTRPVTVFGECLLQAAHTSVCSAISSFPNSVGDSFSSGLSDFKLRWYDRPQPADQSLRGQLSAKAI